jgi:UDPglucose--hexose-1-phosphate uridylyltransferase
MNGIEQVYCFENRGEEIGVTLHHPHGVVAGNEHWTAFVPPAARWPYEVLILPARRVPDLAVALDDPAGAAFGDLYLDALRRFDRLFGTPAPYIAAWHQAPVTDSVARAEFGSHLQVSPSAARPASSSTWPGPSRA